MSWKALNRSEIRGAAYGYNEHLCQMSNIAGSSSQQQRLSGLPTNRKTARQRPNVSGREPDLLILDMFKWLESIIGLFEFVFFESGFLLALNQHHVGAVNGVCGL